MFLYDVLQDFLNKDRKIKRINWKNVDYLFRDKKGYIIAQVSGLSTDKCFPWLCSHADLVADDWTFINE